MSGKYLEYVLQKRKKIGFCILIFVFLLAIGTTALSVESSPGRTIYVSADGSDDQVEINQALEYVAKNPEFTTVHLKGPNTYVISDTILVGSNTVLQGDPQAIIKLKDKADWPSDKPLITQLDSAGIYNVTITGFEIDGNHDRNVEKKKGRRIL